MLTALGLIILGYVAGSIPTGYWLVKALKGIDVRTVGSGSTGATNVLRAAGKGAAAFVLLVDALKGFLPVWLAMFLDARAAFSGLSLADWHLIPPAVAIAAIAGHSRSMFLKFQGGKSAATGLGVILALNPAAGAVTFLLWAALVWITRYVSVASIAVPWVCALLMYVWHSPPSYVACCLLGAAYVTYRHKSNIQRLLAGTELRIGHKDTSPVSSAATTAAGASAGSSADRAESSCRTEPP
jgi:glycerol-3-phosphate acyltransferase PlsY